MNKWDQLKEELRNIISSPAISQEEKVRQAVREAILKWMEGEDNET